MVLIFQLKNTNKVIVLKKMTQWFVLSKKYTSLEKTSILKSKAEYDISFKEKTKAIRSGYTHIYQRNFSLK